MSPQDQTPYTIFQYQHTTSKETDDACTYMLAQHATCALRTPQSNTTLNWILPARQGLLGPVPCDHTCCTVNYRNAKAVPHCRKPPPNSHPSKLFHIPICAQQQSTAAAHFANTYTIMNHCAWYKPGLIVSPSPCCPRQCLPYIHPTGFAHTYNTILHSTHIHSDPYRTHR